MQKVFEEIKERLEEYKYSHLVERDKERLEHCTENERAEHCEGIDCFWCVFEKAIENVNQVAGEYKSNDGWIPCNEPPKDMDWVNILLQLESDAVVCGAYNSKEKSFYKRYRDGYMRIDAKYWRGFPQPYHPKGE